MNSINKNISEIDARFDAMDPEISRRKKNGSKSDETELKKAAYSLAFWEHMHTGMPENSLKAGSDGAGGYLIPDEFENKLLEGLKEHNVLRKLAHTIPTTHKLLIPTEQGGSLAQWTDEEAPYPESDISFGQVELSAHKLAMRVLVTDEMLEDSGINLEEYILKEISEAFADAEEKALFHGNGIGKPMGLIYQAPVGTVSKEIGAISVEDVLDLIYSVSKNYREKSVLVMSEHAYRELHKTKHANGTYIWNPDLEKDQYETLYGYRVYTTRELDDVGEGKIPVLFGCFDHYWIGDRGRRTIKRLTELYADHGQVAYIASERLDAKLVYPDAVKSLKIRDSIDD